MTNDLLSLLAQATTQPWSDYIQAVYSRSQVVLATSSFALFGLTFTAVSTLTRIKDKLYDDPAYQARVKRSRSIEPTLKDYKPFEQLHKVFTFARWTSLVSGVFNLALIFKSNWWLAIIAYVLFALLIGSVVYFAHLFHANLAEITRIDQQKLDDQRKKEVADSDMKANKGYVKLNRT